jgi:hypothetical protein
MVFRSAPIRSISLLAAWFGSGMLCVVVPLLVFAVSRSVNTYNNNNGNNNDDNNNNNNNQGGTPWWFFAASGGQDRRDANGAPPVLIATYLWSLLVFFGILFYGYHLMHEGMDLHGIVVALVLFANYSLLSVFLFSGVEGAVETQGRNVEENGFVGQFGVMVRAPCPFVYLYMQIWMRAR